MAVVPAFCPRCDAIFTPKGALAVAGVDKNLNIPGDRTACAHCGGTAIVLDGIFEFIGDAIRLLAAPRCQPAELEDLARALQVARREAQSRRQVLNEIENATPGLADALGDLLPASERNFRASITILLYVVFGVLLLRDGREIGIDLNITPYLTVLIDRIIESRPWQIPEQNP